MLMHGCVSDHMVAAYDLYHSSLTLEQAQEALVQHYTSPHKCLNPAIANQPAQLTVYPYKYHPLHWLSKIGSRHCQLVWETQQESLTNCLQNADLFQGGEPH